MILRDIAAALAASVDGDGSIEIARIAEPAEAGAAELALAMTREAGGRLAPTPARAVVVAEAIPRGRFAAVITVDRPRRALAILTRLFDRPVHRSPGVHPSAV